MRQGRALLNDVRGCLTQVPGPLDDAAVARWLLQPAAEAAPTLRELQALHAPGARVRMPPLPRMAVADACRSALLAAALAAPLRALLQAAGMLQARTPSPVRIAACIAPTCVLCMHESRRPVLFFHMLRSLEEQRTLACSARGLLSRNACAGRCRQVGNAQESRWEVAGMGRGLAHAPGL